MFLRRLGASGSLCQTGHACPQILELNDGNFAVIGSDITAEAKGRLPHGPGCSSDERIVKIPRHILIEASKDIQTNG